MNERQFKHLEFIQAVILRMNTNSFFVKGWSITLLAAIFALAAKDANQAFILVAYFPIGVFWGLDSFYLGQERRYRSLYDQVAAIELDDDVNFTMDASKLGGKPAGFWVCFLSGTIAAFHGTLLIVTLLVMFGIPILKA
jgi:hypothetical protein